MKRVGNVVKYVIIMVDVNNDGKINFNEFSAIIVTLKSWKRSKLLIKYYISWNQQAANQNLNDVGEIKEEDLRGIFHEFDLNGDGYIQKNELKAVMIKMGQSPTEDELTAMFNAADQDQDGNIDFREFLTIARANPLSLSLKAVFEELDVDGDGQIKRSELRTAFQRMGHTLTDGEINAIYKHVDVNNDGKINFNEFVEMMTRKKPL
uniref:EF-hand domain-containing protein n=1 Tax=Ditylenchus dipsaci TaxID=166011 RepID=A0A915D1Z9_9BILA